MKNFAGLKEGTKVQSYDKDGYYIMRFCGYIIKSFEDGHALIKSFDGNFESTVFSLSRINEVELI